MLKGHLEVMKEHVSALTKLIGTRYANDKRKDDAELRYKKMVTMEVLLRMKSTVLKNDDTLSEFLENELKRTMFELNQM